MLWPCYCFHALKVRRSSESSGGCADAVKWDLGSEESSSGNRFATYRQGTCLIFVEKFVGFNFDWEVIFCCSSLMC